MSFTRGRYGVEYQPRRTHETPNRLPWFVGAILVLSLVAFIWYKVCQKSEASAPPADTDASVHPVQTPGAPEKRRVTPQASSVSVQKLVAKIQAELDQRPGQDRPLLLQYVNAESQGRVDVAASALRKLVRRPALADLHNAFYHRLGDLNFANLLSGTDATLTKNVTVRRGDSLERIAHEHRTTALLVRELNPDIKWEKLRPGMSVRVLDFPNATLVIARDGTADLTFKSEQFFRRYDITVPKDTPAGVYDITQGTDATLRRRIHDLGLSVSSAARQELEMFLAARSRIIVK